MTGKTVLLTGATGFIGRHLHARLESEGARVVALSRMPPSTGCVGTTWVTAGLADLSSDMWRAAGVARVDVVMHLGGHVPKNHAEANDVAGVYDGSILGTRALLESLPNVPERVVFASTLDVYAPADVLTEASPVRPATLYGSGKLFCEHLVREWTAQAGSTCVVLRFGHIVGPGEEAFKKLIPQTIRQLLQAEPPVLYGDGTAERDFLFVGDAVEAAMRAATADLPSGETLNVVRGASVTIRDVVRMLTDLTGASVEPTLLADSPTGASIRFDNRRMHAALGEWDLVPLREALRLEVEHTRAKT